MQSRWHFSTPHPGEPPGNTRAHIRYNPFPRRLSDPGQMPPRQAQLCPGGDRSRRDGARWPLRAGLAPSGAGRAFPQRQGNRGSAPGGKEGERAAAPPSGERLGEAGAKSRISMRAGLMQITATGSGSSSRRKAKQLQPGLPSPAARHSHRQGRRNKGTEPLSAAATAPTAGWSRGEGRREGGSRRSLAASHPQPPPSLRARPAGLREEVPARLRRTGERRDRGRHRDGGCALPCPVLAGAAAAGRGRRCTCAHCVCV